jgi:HEPN domain-containing protein
VVDIAEQIEYWRKGPEEDFEAAGLLITSGKTRHGLFFAHLALEKILKAHICRQTGKLAPRLHNLVRLAELSSLDFEADHLNVLAEMNEFNLEGRYPVTFIPPPDAAEANEYIEKSKEVLAWLMQRL